MWDETGADGFNDFVTFKGSKLSIRFTHMYLYVFIFIYVYNM